MMGEAESNGRTEIYGEYHNHFYVARQRMVRDHDYQLTFNESERGGALIEEGPLSAAQCVMTRPMPT